jgi:hypothetical protein
LFNLQFIISVSTFTNSGTRSRDIRFFLAVLDTLFIPNSVWEGGNLSTSDV